jgi:hypothetical protein
MFYVIILYEKEFFSQNKIKMIYQSYRIILFQNKFENFLKINLLVKFSLKQLHHHLHLSQRNVYVLQHLQLYQ